MQKHFERKKILITGHTGFKGQWLSIWLKDLGAEVFGISQNKNGGHSLMQFNLQDQNSYFFDITDKGKLKSTLHDISPDFIFHLAAQSIVLESYSSPYQTFMTNTVGTLNLLDSLRELNLKTSVVIASSDKCYQNDEKMFLQETTPLGGDDPYSASKASLETIFNCYARSFLRDSKSRVASARAGNVIGGGDWNNDRVIPDCVKAWQQNTPIKLRNPESSRPWQHVLDCLSGYMRLAISLSQNSTLSGQAFNFGPQKSQKMKTRELVNSFGKEFKYNEVEYPFSNQAYNEKRAIYLDSSKSLKILHWQQKLNIEETVTWTSDWYLNYISKELDIEKFSLKQIQGYQSL